MNPNALLYVPADLLRQRAEGQAAIGPMAASKDRLLAAIVCTAFVGLSIALIVVLR
jgi:hypothetical protein